MAHKDGCVAVKYFDDEEKVIFHNNTFHLSICDITTYPLEGEPKKHGWGLYLVNYKKGNDKAYCFKYCPWCGGKI